MVVELPRWKWRPSCRPISGHLLGERGVGLRNKTLGHSKHQGHQSSKLWMSSPLKLCMFWNSNSLMSGIVVLRSGSMLKSGKLSERFGKHLAPQGHESVTVLVAKFQQINKYSRIKNDPQPSKLTCLQTSSDYRFQHDSRWIPGRTKKRYGIR